MKHPAAFCFGLMLGVAAGAAVTIWNAPQAGKETRDQISGAIESIIFTLLGANEATDARILSPDQPSPGSATGNNAAPV